jgi:hypothetical protein
MITNHEEYTPNMNSFEIRVAEFICEHLQGTKTNSPIYKERAIKAPAMCQIIASHFNLPKAFPAQRLRACMNYIRGTRKLFVGSTSKGYFMVHPNDIKMMDSITKSMDERVSGITFANNGLKQMREEAYKKSIRKNGSLF